MQKLNTLTDAELTRALHIVTHAREAIIKEMADRVVEDVVGKPARHIVNLCFSK